MATARLVEPTTQQVRPSRFSHLVLQTPQFDAMKAWYKTFLSAKPMFENAVVCFLSYDDEHHRIMIGNNPSLNPRDPKVAGLVHFAYAVESLDDLVSVYLRLKDEGLIPHQCVNHGFTTSLYYHDPDQNEVEYQVDNFKTREALDAWFSTGAFDSNFFGFRFDPEYMVKRHREGVPEDEILQKDLYR